MADWDLAGLLLHLLLRLEIGVIAGNRGHALVDGWWLKVRITVNRGHARLHRFPRTAQRSISNKGHTCTITGCLYITTFLLRPRSRVVH